MKKFLLLLLATVTLFLMLVSCDKENSEQTTGNSFIQTTDSSAKEDKTEPDVEKEPISPPVSLSYWEENIEKSCYATLDCGEYFGKDFIGINYGEHLFRIIETYEELSSSTAKGNLFPEAVFENSVVLALSSFVSGDENYIGYSDFQFNNGRPSIVSYIAESDFGEENVEAIKETVYLKIPKELADKTVIGGKIDVSINTSHSLDYAVMDGKNTNIREGSVWMVDAKGLESFLRQKNISGMPSWSRYDDYSDKDYKILVVCHTAAESGIVGYSDLVVNEHNITVDRTYLYGDKKGEKKVIEFIAIPSDSLKPLTGVNPYLVINNAAVLKENLSSMQRVENVFVVEKQEYEYYDFLDLGIYYFESALPEGFSYHIFTRYEELELYVEKPFVNSVVFEENYIVMLRIGGYVPKSSFGIRNLHFDNNAELFANMEFGGRTYSHEFQSEYCYVVVPKKDFNYFPNSTRQKNMGELNLTIKNYWARGEYRTLTEKPTGNYQVNENSVWIIKSDLEAKELEKKTGLSVGRYLERNKFLFIYYGIVESRAQFEGFLSDEHNVYINMSYLNTNEDSEPRYFIIPIDISLLKCTSSNINAHMFIYKQNKATIQKVETPKAQTLDSFYASHYGGQTLKKVPEFTYHIIKNQEEYERVLLQYTSFEAFPGVDFEKNSVLAYYVYEGCTGCDSASSFGNLRYAYGRIYIDHYKKAHGGGDAMNSTLYFILIDKEELDREIINVYLIEKDNYSNGDDIYFDEIPSEYKTHIFSTHGAELKGAPDFEYKIVTSYEELCELYEKYTYLRPGYFETLDFDAMCILAIYTIEPGSADVFGGFKNMRIANNIIYLTKYYPKYEGGDEEILGDCLTHPTLHFIAVEKTFVPEDITDIIILKEQYAEDLA